MYRNPVYRKVKGRAPGNSGPCVNEINSLGATRAGWPAANNLSQAAISIGSNRSYSSLTT